MSSKDTTPVRVSKSHMAVVRRIAKQNRWSIKMACDVAIELLACHYGQPMAASLPPGRLTDEAKQAGGVS